MSKKDIIQDYIDKLYYLNTDKEKLKTFEEIDPNILRGYIKLFLRLTDEYIVWDRKKKRDDDRTNMNNFGAKFIGLSEAYQIALFEATITDYIGRWYRVLYHGTLTGRPRVKINRFLEERGATQQIKNHSLIIAEADRLVRIEEEKKEKERLEAIETRKKKRLERKRNDIIYEKVEKYKKSISKPLWDIPFSEQPKEREKINEKVRLYEEELRNEL